MLFFFIDMTRNYAARDWGRGKTLLSLSCKVTQSTPWRELSPLALVGALCNGNLFESDKCVKKFIKISATVSEYIIKTCWEMRHQSELILVSFIIGSVVAMAGNIVERKVVNLRFRESSQKASIILRLPTAYNLICIRLFSIVSLISESDFPGKRKPKTEPSIFSTISF